MRLELLYFEGCPHWRLADERLAAIAAERGFEVAHRLVDTPEEAEAMGFRGVSHDLRRWSRPVRSR